MWVDIVFWVLIALFALIGLWKGLFDSLLSLLGSGIAVGLAIWLAKPAAAFINKIIDLPKMFGKLIEDMFKNKPELEIFGQAFSKENLAAFLSYVCAGIIVFILFKLAIWLLAKLFDGVTKKSTIASGLNKIFGLFFGLIKGAFIAVVLLVICSILSNTQILGNEIDNTINKSTTTKWVFKYVDEATEKYFSKIDMDKFLQDIVDEQEDEKPADTTPTPAPAAYISANYSTVNNIVITDCMGKEIFSL